jgi:hypothetical protein
MDGGGNRARPMHSMPGRAAPMPDRQPPMRAMP